MQAARRNGRTDLIEKVPSPKMLIIIVRMSYVNYLGCHQAEVVLLATLEFGWDKEYGGFFYFMDIGILLAPSLISFLLHSLALCAQMASPRSSLNGTKSCGGFMASPSWHWPLPTR
jgi:hypothetical protein